MTQTQQLPPLKKYRIFMCGGSGNFVRNPVVQSAHTPENVTLEEAYKIRDEATIRTDGLIRYGIRYVE